MNSIKCSNIRDMAAVLGVSEGAVAHAALESMGISASAPDGSSIYTALSLNLELSARDKKLVRVLLGAMSAVEESEGRASTAPLNEPAGDSGGNRRDDDVEIPAESAAG